MKTNGRKLANTDDNYAPDSDSSSSYSRLYHKLDPVTYKKEVKFENDVVIQVSELGNNYWESYYGLRKEDKKVAQKNILKTIPQDFSQTIYNSPYMDYRKTLSRVSYQSIKYLICTR